MLNAPLELRLQTFYPVMRVSLVFVWPSSHIMFSVVWNFHVLHGGTTLGFVGPVGHGVFHAFASINWAQPLELWSKSVPGLAERKAFFLGKERDSNFCNMLFVWM